MTIGADAQSTGGVARRADIQGLRATAILFVVLFHASVGLSGGYTGVDVFFAISGFVITSTLVGELERTGRLRLGRFYMRRIRRLLPALALMLVVVAALGTFAAPLAGQRTGGMTGIFAALFAGNLYLANLANGYFATAASLDPLLHTWTLGVEEQFYLFFPLVLLLGWWIGSRALLRESGRRLGAAALVLLVAAASLLLAVALVRGIAAGGQNGLRFWFYGSPARAWEFAAGAAAALLLPWLRRLPAITADVLGFIGLALVVGGAVLLSDAAEPSPERLLLLPVAGTCALLVSGATRATSTSRLLSIAPFVVIGDLSYSWYLWHWPLIVYAKAIWPTSGLAAPAAAVGSLLPAWLSYRYVENPIRYRLPLTRRNIGSLAAICVVVPVAASAGLVMFSNSIAGRPWIARWKASQINHLDVTRECDGAIPGRVPIRRCMWRVPHARGTIILTGDSNAGQFSEPVVGAANEAGFNAELITHSGCPYADVVAVLPGIPPGNCRAWIVATIKAVIAQHPRLVIAANRTDYFFSSFELAPPGGALTPDRSTKVHIWTSGLHRALSRTNAAGVPVLLVQPVPMLQTPAGDCAVIRVLTSSCLQPEPKREVDEELKQAIEANNAAAFGLPSTRTISFENLMCARASCSSVRNHVLLYRDSRHLSVQGSELLTRRFYNAIRTVTDGL